MHTLLLALACTGKSPAPADDTGVGDTAPPEAPSYTPCEDPITSPEQVAQELIGWNPADVAYNELTTRLAEDCRSSCDEGDACSDWDCVDAEGVTLTYHLVETILRSDASAVQTLSAGDATLTWPAGAPLAHLTLHREYTYTRYLEADAGGAWADVVSAHWTGLLAETLPEDSALTEEGAGWSDDCCGGLDRTFTVDDCAARHLDVDTSSYGYAVVERADQRVIYWEPDVWIDGACYGEVEPITYARVGDCAHPDDPPPEP